MLLARAWSSMTGAHSLVSTPRRRRSVSLKRRLVRIRFILSGPPYLFSSTSVPQNSKDRMQVPLLARCAMLSSTIGHESYDGLLSPASLSRSIFGVVTAIPVFCTLHLSTFASKEKYSSAQ